VHDQNGPYGPFFYSVSFCTMMFGEQTSVEDRCGSPTRILNSNDAYSLAQAVKITAEDKAFIDPW